MLSAHTKIFLSRVKKSIAFSCRLPALHDITLFYSTGADANVALTQLTKVTSISNIHLSALPRPIPDTLTEYLGAFPPNATAPFIPHYCMVAQCSHYRANRSPSFITKATVQHHWKSYHIAALHKMTPDQQHYLGWNQCITCGALFLGTSNLYIH